MMHRRPEHSLLLRLFLSLLLLMLVELLLLPRGCCFGLCPQHNVAHICSACAPQLHAGFSTAASGPGCLCGSSTNTAALLQQHKALRFPLLGGGRKGQILLLLLMHVWPHLCVVATATHDAAALLQHRVTLLLLQHRWQCCCHSDLCSRQHKHLLVPGCSMSHPATKGSHCHRCKETAGATTTNTTSTAVAALCIQLRRWLLLLPLDQHQAVVGPQSC